MKLKVGRLRWTCIEGGEPEKDAPGCTCYEGYEALKHQKERSSRGRGTVDA